MKLGSNYFRRDADNGFYPIFSKELNRRVANKEACVTVVVGEAGMGKSYFAMQLARNIDKRFGIDQIIFTYGDYIKEIQNLSHAGIPVCFDEPSYAMGKREWYKQINMALVKTIESQRFLVRPLIIPIINVNLLDKTLRDFLVIFQVHITKRGRAMVYRMRASQGEDKVYRYLICNLDYDMLDFDKCTLEIEARANAKEHPEDKSKVNKSSCLDCKLKESCDLLRAKYERKKMTIQLSRYEQDEEQAKTRESKELTLEQLVTQIEPYKDIYMTDGKVDARKLRYAFHQKLGIKIGHNKSYEVKTMIELQEKELGNAEKA